MKTLFKTTLIISMVLMVSCGTGTPVEENGQLSVDGVNLVNANSEILMLHGVSFGWHNWWPRFYNEGAVKELADDWGVNVVRAAMGVGVSDDYISKPEWTLEKIEAVISAAINNGIYVIIDWHSHGIHLDEAVEFFASMAKTYGSYPNVIYEIFNEPVHDSWDTVKYYSIEVIKAIREYDPDNVILVGSPHWDQDVHIVADDPIQGYENLMYTLHFYAGTHHESLRQRGNYALEKGLPLFVSESAGMEANGDGPIDYQEWQAWIDWMMERKISWISWSIADKDETCSMLYPSANSEGNWTEADLKESGQKTREFNRELAGLN